MSDRFTQKHRSWNMSRIRGRDTAPEMLVRSTLHRLGYRFRLHAPGLPGRPDIVVPRLNVAIFVNGCFWHRHPGCALAYTPKSRLDFWSAKFAQTVARDIRNWEDLIELGWEVIVIWECEIENSPSFAAELVDRLGPHK